MVAVKSRPRVYYIIMAIETNMVRQPDTALLQAWQALARACYSRGSGSAPTYIILVCTEVMYICAFGGRPFVFRPWLELPFQRPDLQGLISNREDSQSLYDPS